MHPVCRYEWLILPLRLLIEEEIDVPCECAATRERYDFSEGDAETFVVIPKVLRTIVLDELRCFVSSHAIVLTQYGRPYDIDFDVVAVQVFKDLFSHHTGTVATGASRGRQDDDEANHAAIFIESVAELLFVVR